MNSHNIIFHTMLQDRPKLHLTNIIFIPHFSFTAFSSHLLSVMSAYSSMKKPAWWLELKNSSVVISFAHLVMKIYEISTRISIHKKLWINNHWKGARLPMNSLMTITSKVIETKKYCIHMSPCNPLHSFWKHCMGIDNKLNYINTTGINFLMFYRNWILLENCSNISVLKDKKTFFCSLRIYLRII